MENVLQTIIKEAIYAPSGDNEQPWRFEIYLKELRIDVYNLPERDQTLYNFKQRGSYVAHGALIENISIVASNYELEANIKLFPVQENRELVCQINFKKLQDTKKDKLYQFIRERKTNRKVFKVEPINDLQREQLHASFNTNWAGLKIIEDSYTRKKVAEALSSNERLLLENRVIHDFLFANIRWSETEEREKKRGLYAKTLELKPPQLAVFSFCRSWVVSKILCSLGLSKIMAKDTSTLYANSPLIGAVVISDDKDESFINGGRAIQRLWLTTTALGLSFQPVTGLPYLWQRLAAGDNSSFTNKQVILIEKAYRVIDSIFNLDSKIIAMSFRIGKADKPSASSSRLDPMIVINN